MFDEVHAFTGNFLYAFLKNLLLHQHNFYFNQLFIFSSNNSVKENNKSSSRFAVPKVPLKRSKSRLAKSDTPESGLATINDFSELVNKLEKEDEKQIIAPTQTAPLTPPTNLVQEAVQMQKQSAEGLMSLLRIVGKAFSYLTSYESRQAIETVEKLSVRHKRSSWVLSLMAKAHFELADYKQAARYKYILYTD